MSERDVPAIVNPHFGELYGWAGEPAFLTTAGVPVWMWRKGQRVRFYDAAGQQVGPQHANVVPATVWAFGHGWIDPASLALSLAAIEEVRSNSRYFDDRNADAGAWPYPAVAG